MKKDTLLDDFFAIYEQEKAQKHNKGFYQCCTMMNCDDCPIYKGCPYVDYITNKTREDNILNSKIYVDQSYLLYKIEKIKKILK